MIFTDTNILLRGLLTSDPHYLVTERALSKLRERRVQLCIAPQTLVEFWAVATRPAIDNGLGLSVQRAEIEIKALLRLFHLLRYTNEVLKTWRRIVVAQSIVGKQTHDAHIAAMMQAHSITSILTFNGKHFNRVPGITVLNPYEV